MYEHFFMFYISLFKNINMFFYVFNNLFVVFIVVFLLLLKHPHTKLI